MDFELDDNQKALERRARAFARERVEAGAPARELAHEFPLTLFKEAAALGFAGCLVPRASKGSPAAAPRRGSWYAHKIESCGGTPSSGRRQLRSRCRARQKRAASAASTRLSANLIHSASGTAPPCNPQPRRRQRSKDVVVRMKLGQALRRQLVNDASE